MIVGLGNPLRGDDGIGPRAVEEVTRQGLPEGVTALDCGTGGLDLLSILEDPGEEAWERVVVVDAADLGREPGQFARFTTDQVHVAQDPRGFSFHHAGLGDVLALADALDRTLPEMIIFGVQPGKIGWGEGLSPAVEAALPDLVNAVFKEIKGESNAQDSGD